MGRGVRLKTAWKGSFWLIVAHPEAALKKRGQFTRKMELAVAALLSEGTQEQAAQKVGISLATIKRWKEQPAFKRALRAARLGVLEEVGDLYLRMAKRAAVVIWQSMEDDAPHAIRMRAAEDVNDAIEKIVGIPQVKAELDELRALVEEKHHATGTVSSRNGAASR
jgi:hypothetical protein